MVQILVIDDDPVTQLLLRHTLEQQGYGVAIAQNGAEGIHLAQAHPPALIICDWMMPIVDGIEVCRRIKSNPILSTSFFILLTSRGDLEDRIEGLNAGADEFLGKPIDMNELKARVRAGLRLYHLNQDLQIQTQRLEAELAEAAAYVRSILPAELEGPVMISSRYIPSRQLGGDCFNYYWITPESLVIYLLDVSGHGLGAALPSISILNWLRSHPVSEIDYQQPHQVLQVLNRMFQMSAQHQKYFTIWYGVYHHPQRQLVYASAGHPPALLVSADCQLQSLKTPGLPIGLFEEGVYQSNQCTIPPHSILYIFSDGIYEIQQSNGQIWGLEGFKQLLQHTQASNLMSLDTLLDGVHHNCGKTTFEDDLSLIQVNFC